MQPHIGKISRTIPMVIVMGVIFILSHQSGENLDLPSIPFIDKVAHLIIYSLLGSATLYSFSPSFLSKEQKKCVALSVIFCCLYGISDELHQSLVPGRFVSGFDVLADVAGGFLGCLAFIRLKGIISSASFRKEKVE